VGSSFGKVTLLFPALFGVIGEFSLIVMWDFLKLLLGLLFPGLVTCDLRGVVCPEFSLPSLNLNLILT